MEVGTAVLGRRHGGQPVSQVYTGARDQRVEQQRRQREVINQVRLVAVAEIRDVLMVGHVGLGNDHRFVAGVLDEQAHETDDFMSLRQVHAARALLLPQEADRIEAEPLHALIEVVADDAQAFHQHFGIGEVEIDLIRREGAPNVLLTVEGFHLGEQRTGTRANDIGPITLGVGGNEVVLARLFTPEELLKPRTLRGTMVEHHVPHDLVVLSQTLHVTPLPELIA